MTDQNPGQGKERSEEARQANRDRRTEQGKDPKSHGPGGNPDKGEDPTEEPDAPAEEQPAAPAE